MTEIKLEYDNVWRNIRVDSLKPMASVWGGSPKSGKEALVSFLQAAITDKSRIDAMLAAITRCERATLGVLKMFGGNLTAGRLDTAIRATGTAPASDVTKHTYGTEFAIQSALDRGIIMSAWSDYSMYSYTRLQQDTPVFADHRILAQTRGFEHVPLPLAAAERPAASIYRRASTVVLDVISVLRAVESIGGVGFTKSGEWRVHDIRKFSRKMGWTDEIEIDGLVFPKPVDAYLLTLLNAGLLVNEGEKTVGGAPLEQIGASPAVEIIQGLMRGVCLQRGWAEADIEGNEYWIGHTGHNGRTALIAALRCLPDPHAWFQFEDFANGLFDRIGGHFSTSRIPYPPYGYNRTSEAMQLALDHWRSELRQNWQRFDVPWLQSVFQTWLYAFGFVEIHIAEGAVREFRLTDVARALLWEETPPETTSPANQTPGWLVQPNFDVVVYLDEASTEQVAFLEQHSERVQFAQHTAHYQLTRDSIYEGLQRGVTVDHLLERLAAGSRVELPSNVVAEIRNWAGLRERLTVRQQADLIEFPNEKARAQALARGIPGVSVGERFLLLPADYKTSEAAKAVAEVHDYVRDPVENCLRISEDGVITLETQRSDLLTVGALDLWAERKGDAAWKLTRESVSAAVRRGRTSAELITFLQVRSAVKLPGLLTIALRAWAGAPTPVGMGHAVVLQCRQPEMLDALLKSRLLKPHLLGTIGPDSLLVNRSSEAKVRAILEWASIQLTDAISPILL